MSWGDSSVGTKSKGGAIGTFCSLRATSVTAVMNHLGGRNESLVATTGGGKKLSARLSRNPLPSFSTVAEDSPIVSLSDASRVLILDSFLSSRFSNSRFRLATAGYSSVSFVVWFPTRMFVEFPLGGCSPVSSAVSLVFGVVDAPHGGGSPTFQHLFSLPPRTSLAT